MTNPPPADKPEPKRPEPKYSKLHLHHEPIGHASPGGKWPDRGIKRHSPPAAYLLRGIALRLKKHMNDRNMTLEDIESLTGVNVSSLSRLLRGDSWGSVPIIAHLETHLDTDLWGNEHRRR